MRGGDAVSEAEAVRRAFSARIPSRSSGWKRPSSSRSSRPGGCCTPTPSGFSWSGAARGRRWPTGWALPSPSGSPGWSRSMAGCPSACGRLRRLKACRDLRCLVVHGAWNARVPLSDARQNVATLRAGGLRVAFQSYPSAHRLSNPMLSDVDTWLMGHCTAGPSRC